MTFTKGHKLSVGNKGGRRPSVKEEIEAAKEMITQDALIKLANSKVYKQLVALQDFKDTKEMALPITLRGIIERKELSGKDGQPLIIQFDESFNKRNEPTGKSEN